MGIKKSFLLLICLVVALGCGPRKSEKAQDNTQNLSKSSITGNIEISGAYALYPAVQRWAGDFMKILPGVKITVTKTGTGQGIIDLLSKKIKLAMISRPLTDAEVEEGIWIVPVAKDGVAPIVNQNNPFLQRLLKQGLSPDELQKVFTSEVPVSWGELLDTTGNSKAAVFSRADESGAADILAKLFFREAEDLKGTKVTGDEEMIRSIQQNPLGIGFCNFSFAFNSGTGERMENIQVIPFDLDFDNKINRKETPFQNLEAAHRSIWMGIYPENLCRDLTIGSLGKPTDPAVIEFLRYILSDGQEYVAETGLCKLNSIYTGFALENLK
jgi:phosphate transport system substrate-binding protein